MKPFHKVAAALGLACTMIASAGAVAVTSVPAAATNVATTAVLTEATSSTAVYGHHHGGGHHGCYTQQRSSCYNSGSCHTWTTDCNGNRYCTTHGGYCGYCVY